MGINISAAVHRLVMVDAKSIARTYQGKEILPEHLVFALLRSENTAAVRIIKKLHIIDQDLIDLIEMDLPKPKHQPLPLEQGEVKVGKRINEIISQGVKLSHNMGDSVFRTDHLLYALLSDNTSTFYHYLIDSGLTMQTVAQHIKDQQRESSMLEQRVWVGKKRRTDEEDDLSKSVDSVSFIAHYTTDIIKQTTDSTIDPVVDRPSYMNALIRIMGRRKKNSPILVGEPGVGKRSLVYGLARNITSGDVPDMLKGKQILSINLDLLMSGVAYRGDLENRVQTMVNEIVDKGNIILFIDEIHNYLTSENNRGMELLTAMRPLFTGSEIICIGATTPTEYRKCMEGDPLVEREFQALEVEPASINTTTKILQSIVPYYEAFHNLRFDKEGLNQAVMLSDRYITDGFLPEKAVDLLDEACSHAKLMTGKGAKVVTKATIQEIVAEKTGIPVVDIKRSDADRLLRMEQDMHEFIVGQDQAVHAIASCIRRSRSGLIDRKRPIGSFAFLGPTGVGKSYLAKTLSHLLFGSEQALMRFDMSDYMERHSTSRLVGAPPGYIGYDEGGILSERVRKNPYSIVLFDEIEKAHPDVFNLLLQILEEGELQDNMGQSISFKNTIIIMTSNIGHDCGNDIDEATQRLKKHFRPEFINRIDEIILFNPLQLSDIEQILDLLLDEINISLVEKEITLRLSPQARYLLTHSGYDLEMGARPLRRIVQKEIEDKISVAYLEGDLRAGTIIEFYETNGALAMGLRER